MQIPLPSCYTEGKKAEMFKTVNIKLINATNHLPRPEDTISRSPQIFPLEEGEQSSDSTTRNRNTAGTQPCLPWYLRSDSR